MEENKSIWERLHSGEAINMRTDSAFARDTIPEMNRSLGLCSDINKSRPYDKETRRLEEELFSGGLSANANILSPMEIDYGRQVKIHDNVFINHSVCMSAAAGIEIEEGVMIAPQVTILTVNHDLKDKIVIMCKPVVIKKGAWIGARAVILPGVTVGENAVVGAGAVVTKDVPANTVVVGCPAKVVKQIA